MRNYGNIEIEIRIYKIRIYKILKIENKVLEIKFHFFFEI